jgi:DNA-binding response OmpR family regulator
MITIENYKKTINIMYIEDDVLATTRLKNILEKYFNKIIIASNGEEAFEKINTEPKIDLIISDINMPKMDGLEFLEELRKDNFDMPFIFVTARDEPDKMLKAIQLDIDNYVLKPINLQNLLSVIDKIIDRLYKEYLTLERNSHIKLEENLFWNKNNKTLISDNNIIKLTKKELLFIDILMSDETKVHSIEDIISVLWEDDFLEKDYVANLKNIISRLRSKVPALNIENLYGMGYKIKLIKEN